MQKSARTINIGTHFSLFLKNISKKTWFQLIISDHVFKSEYERYSTKSSTLVFVIWKYYPILWSLTHKYTNSRKKLRKLLL